MKDSHEENYNRLLHIQEAIVTIEKFAKGETLETFCENEMLNNAIMLQFIIIGEAIVHVDSNKLDKYDYPWYKVKSFRNMLAHEYFNIKLPAVWYIIETNLQQLKVIIQSVLDNEFKYS